MAFHGATNTRYTKYQINYKAGVPAKGEHGIQWCQDRALYKFQQNYNAGGPAKGEHEIPWCQELALYKYPINYKAGGPD